MSNGRFASAILATVAAALIGLHPGTVSATQRYGPIQLSGNLQTLNLVRTPDESTYEYIMNRNVAHIRLDYDILQAGKFYERYDIPFVESGHLFLLWRGVYDSVYDTTPGFVQKFDIKGRNYPASETNFLTYYDYATKILHLRGNRFELSGLTKDERDTLKFENTLREFYMDLKMRGLPLTVRAGKQQIVWGETDNFRMLDRANALDLTWHFQQEIPAPAYGWDEIRQTYWMLKFLYTLDQVGPISQSFLEWYWNPGDWRPAKQTYLPRPWGLPLLNPLTNPIDGVFNAGPCAPAPGGRCTRLINDTRLFEKGDWTRDPFDNSQVGVRFHGMSPIPQGLEFTLNYFYQRWAGDDGTNYAQLQGLPDTPANEKRRDTELIPHRIFPAEFIAPYVHTIGASANYSDETFTQTVFRFETVYDVGIPFYDVGKVTVIDKPALPGISKKNMWKGMIAFDRPTWIRTLNKKSTVFLTGQFFWHYMVNNPSCRAQDQARLSPAARAAAGSCLVGGLDLPSTVRNSNVSFRDKIRDWETLETLAAFTFYRGGSIVPILGIAVDTTNQFNMEPFWTVDYFIRSDLAVNIAQRYFIAPRGYSTPIFETWGIAGLNRGRSETEIRLTYQF